MLAALYLAAPRFGAVDAHNRVLEAQNRQMLHWQLADCLKRENAALRHELARLVRLGHFGAANEPLAMDLRQLRAVPEGASRQAHRPST